MSIEPEKLTLCEAAEAIRTRRISSEDLTRYAIARSQAVQPKLNCYISIDEEGALEAARAADKAVAAGRPLGTLHGVPLAHKDMFYRAGHITTGGSKLLKDYRPEMTATVVERLDEAGAIWLGNLNMSEFAANPTGHNDSYGNCRNAWNPNHISGGSSSGSGVAVAARACFGSLGSDTGGSIRLPAAANGVVGIRPTYSLVSRYGALPRTWSLDTIGPLTQTVRDCARMLQVIAGHDARDPSSDPSPVPDYEQSLNGDIEGLRIGVPTNYFHEGVSDEVARCMQESLRQLESQGARIVELPVPDPEPLYHFANLVSQVEAASIHANWLRERADEYPLVLRTRIESGFLVPAVNYLDALRARTRLATEYLDQVFDKVDVLHTAVMNMPAPSFEDTSPTATGEVMAMLARISRNIRPFSFLGFPALSVPAGMSATALPIAFQLVARPFDEALLFRIGDAYQRHTTWHQLMPA